MRKLIAILRGVKPDEVTSIAEALILAGITKIEVPLNSPDPLKSIYKMAKNLEGQGDFGAGTVLKRKEVLAVHEAGATFVVSPNCDKRVIRATKAAGMNSYPGVFSPSECFAALKAGADALKIFPANLIGTEGVSAMRAVLPAEIEIYAVGGAGPENFADWVSAGADGFGLGSALYKPGMQPTEVAELAARAVSAYDAAFRDNI